MVWTTYKEKIKRLSQRLVEAQRPIRILDAIKWDPSIEAGLRKSRYKQMPKVDAAYYESIPLPFDVAKKQEELREIIADISASLGDQDSVGRLLSRICEEYIEVTELLLARGTKRFWEVSRKLYGSPKDAFFDEKNTILDLGQMLYGILSSLNEHSIGPDYPENIEAEEVVDALNERFKEYFPDGGVQARLSDGIVADAAAGGDVVKIKSGALFSSRDIDILEVHEGWVHAGTTQNGNLQHIAKWLSKGPPRCAATQEGLAVIMEIFTFRSYPRRARAINDRILGIDKAEDGANILELIEFYRTEGYSEDECLFNAKRVFRGGVVEGGAPFTKDISYCRGFVENYNFMRAAIRLGRPYLIPFIFSGKLHVDDIPLIYQKYKEGIVDEPRYLPPQFRDLNGVAVWMSFSSFLNSIDLKRIQDHYDKLFKAYL
ncbi:MAG: flavohemoglobin expression-modulating QEGLA motif protein [Oligoflexia bacterium]|nr:flavohemoglobin expression-modulating QEGLA motif protein [Oligoflexia bacterium]